MELTPVPAAPAEVMGIANMKGKVVTVLSMSALLSREDRSGIPENHTVNVVVFKPFADSEGQMGLKIDQPGYLVEIDEHHILPPPAPEEAAETIFLSGVVESYGMLYRLIQIDTIISRFSKSGDRHIEMNHREDS